MRTLDPALGVLTRLAFHPDGSQLIVAGHGGLGRTRWPPPGDVPNPFELHPTDERIGDFAWDPAGRRLAVAGLDSGAVQLRDARLRVRRELVGLTGQQGPTAAVAFSPDGTLLALGGGWWGEPAVAVVVPVGRRNPARTVGGAANQIGALVFTRPDVLVVGAADRTVVAHRLDPAQGDMLGIDFPSPIQALAVRPDGRQVAVAAGNKVHAWQLGPDGRPTAAGPVGHGHKRIVRAVAYSPDGRSLASAGEDGTVRFWDPDAGTGRAALDVGVGPLRTVAYAPDGLTVVAAGDAGRVVVIDAD